METLSVDVNCEVVAPSQGVFGNYRLKVAGATIELAPDEFQALAKWAKVQQDDETALRVSLEQKPKDALAYVCTTAEGSKVRLQLAASRDTVKKFAAYAKP
jgi:hypothetical protein